MIFPDIEAWSPNVLTDAALSEMIEASNAYALCEFRDPVNDIYAAMWNAVVGFIPQLLTLAVERRLMEGLKVEDLKIIVIALRKAARTSHPEIAAREREIAFRILKMIPPPFTPEEVEP